MSIFFCSSFEIYDILVLEMKERRLFILKKKNLFFKTFCLFFLVLCLTGCGKREKVYVEMDIVNYGKMTLELDPNIAPKTVQNFVDLVEKGFYDGLTFHRIIDGFMIQGGDPLGTGLGGSDKKIVGEFENNGFKNKLSHKRGVISMARAANDMNSASSQFFIMQEDNPSLDGDYAAFGIVTEGIEIVDEICKNTKVEDDNGTVLKENQPKIRSVKIIENKK